MNPIDKYSYTKAIRFKVMPASIKSDDLKPEKIEDAENPLVELMIEGPVFLEKLREQIYFSNYRGEQNLTKNVEIKKAWLKNHFRYNFFQGKHSKANFTLQDNDYVKESFEKWFDLWEETFENLKDISSQEDHEKTRRSEIASLITNLIKKDSLSFIEDFFKESIHKNEQSEWENLISSCEKIKDILTRCGIKYLPSKTAGLVLANASMNYYTVNKKPKEYDEVLEKLKRELKERRDEYKYENGVLSVKVNNKRSEFSFKFKPKERAYWNNYSKESPIFSIDEIYGLMKTFRANMKSSLYEDINKEGSIQEIERNYSLFSDDSLEGVFDLTKEIEDLNRKNILSENEKKLRSEMRQKRGLHFIKFSPDKKKFGIFKHFREYYKFCEAYKFIAIERGKILARVKGIEKEKIDSQNTQFWALLFSRETDGKRKISLCLVPRDFRKKASEFLKNIDDSDSHGPYGKIMRIHSLTKRALHKLCFAEESTFVKEMPETMWKKQSAVKKATNDPEELEKRIRRKTKKGWKVSDDDRKAKEELELEFLKEVIGSEYAEGKLDLGHFDLDECKKAESAYDFEKKLEQTCYFKEVINFSSKEKFEDFLDSCNVSLFDITSYDLEEHPKNTYQTPESCYKRHTREIWNKFWSGDNSVRLNPEIRINFREKDDKMKKYLESMQSKKEGFKLDDSNFRHRRLQEQYTLKLTFELNAGKKYPELAFADTGEIKEKIDDFNEEFNNEREWTELWKYGIDRGNIELATLCLAKFKENDIYKDHNGKPQPRPTFPNAEEDIKCYELLESKYNEKSISEIERSAREKSRNPNPPNEKNPIDNISYFIDRIGDESWFRSCNATCIDLTTAKVIKGHIILNGDVKTYLKLKKVAAKRFIYDFFTRNKVKESSNLRWKNDIYEGVLIIDTNEENTEDEKKTGLSDREKIIYYFSDKHKSLLPKGEIEQNLNNYLENLRKAKSERESRKEKKLILYDEHTPTIEQLNHLRDSVVSNMVGVLSFLQKKYPGIIVLEDLNKKTIDKHFSEHQENISRRLENKLYHKFQTLGLIPPHIKNLVEIREKEQKLQVGALFYVAHEGTSRECPYCGEPWNFDEQDENKMKFEKHQYKCGEKECGFDTANISDKFSDFKDINDPDKVAAFNVAKRRKKKPKRKA